ncbi:MAG: reverse transcriptase domain-containing protein, partial [Bacteroidota bacterium]
MRLGNVFYADCIKAKVAPKFIQQRIKRSANTYSPKLEKVFLADEINRQKKMILKIKLDYNNKLVLSKTVLTELDLIRWLRLLSFVDRRHEIKVLAKHKRTVSFLQSSRFGNASISSINNIRNLSDYELDEDERFVLSKGLNYSIPPPALRREEVFAEFEVLAAQLNHRHPVNDESKQELNSRLVDLAHGYCGAQLSQPDILMHRQCFRTLSRLKKEDSIRILKPDKGGGVVVMNTSDYVAKMKLILDDETKFKMIGEAENCDRTAKIESKLQRLLLKLHKDDQLSQQEYETVRPTGSQRPRLYGLPKVHKTSIPLRPILSMVGSAYHNLAKWLNKAIEPVQAYYSENCISDSFTFSRMIRGTDKAADYYMCSFDVSSLFTNVPLQETINICKNALFNLNLNTSSLSADSFDLLMNQVTSSVEFSFNNCMYRQVDGVAMGSPLGPALANIFVGYYEKILFSSVERPPVYVRYVDDTFAMFEDVADCREFHDRINNLHSCLRFTKEEEDDCGRLPFLDVLVERNCSQAKMLTSVYRKPSFSGEYVRWNSFCDQKRKINLIKTLTHRALTICSEEKLQDELGNIRELLIRNGYPESRIHNAINQVLRDTASISPERDKPRLGDATSDGSYPAPAASDDSSPAPAASTDSAPVTSDDSAPAASDDS